MPEPKVVKNRVHLDLLVPDVEVLLGLGATVLADHEDDEWVVLADPEGNELCAFPDAEGRSSPACRPRFALCVDSDGPVEIAAVARATRRDHRPGSRRPAPLAARGRRAGRRTAPVRPVADERAAKNRCHWDVSAATSAASSPPAPPSSARRTTRSAGPSSGTPTATSSARPPPIVSRAGGARLSWPCMSAFGRARAARSMAIGPMASGSSTGSAVGPRCQLSATASTEPDASNTRPVTSRDSGEASHTQIGAIHCGPDLASSSARCSGVGWAKPPRPSVMRVSAPGRWR